ncbi:hypothetical protein AX774_g5812 [Zancudomyces culisetae]|uniref:Kinase n=1 Tax=Zancudomyces culisetae TaxID=1213189 RepID=A0A1R1PII1_ZANCU|nr:hypothetical protein AX774_g7463 [Zancudomyces culisetae]OMH80748.1 hypothetical protein AX774_g5812 [Zancudomyces culisetae]|eukprot:OMH79128.1 hypothetical protein AX774_g7463 [Zancudomyces culisetae]
MGQTSKNKNNTGKSNDSESVQQMINELGSTLHTSKLTELTSKVTGHDTILAVEGDNMLIKKVESSERHFYDGCLVESIESEMFYAKKNGDDTTRIHSTGTSTSNYDCDCDCGHNEHQHENGNLSRTENGYRHIKQFARFVPRVYGYLQNHSTGSEYICMENLTFGREERVSVLDLKIGYRYYDEYATRTKKLRMIKKASETSSGRYGIKICGIREGKQSQSTLVPEDINTDGVVVSMNANPDTHVQANGVDKDEARRFVLEEKGGVGETRIDTGEDGASDDCDTSDDDEEEEEEEEEEKEERMLRNILDLRAIDFCHSFWTPGEGPDSEYIMGVSNAIKVLQQIYCEMTKKQRELI